MIFEDACDILAPLKKATKPTLMWSLWVGGATSETGLHFFVIWPVFCGQMAFKNLIQGENAMKRFGFVLCLMALLAAMFVSPASAEGSDWDKSSIVVEGACVGDEIVFEITNSGSGDMQGPVVWELHAGTKDGAVLESGEVGPLMSGESATLTFNYDVKVFLKVYQRPGHPGTGVAWADVDLCSVPPTSTVVPPTATASYTPTSTSTSTSVPATVTPTATVTGTTIVVTLPPTATPPIRKTPVTITVTVVKETKTPTATSSFTQVASSTPSTALPTIEKTATPTATGTSVKVTESNTPTSTSTETSHRRPTATPKGGYNTGAGDAIPGGGKLLATIACVILALVGLRMYSQPEPAKVAVRK